MRRCKGDRALLEGPHLLAEALGAGLALEEILATESFLATAEYRGLQEQLPGPPLLVAPGILDSLCDADSPRGVLAVARLPRGGVDSLSLPPTRMLVAAEGLQDPGNLGALARATEAAGAEGLALTTGSVHPNHPRALRASAGSLLRLPAAVDVELEDLRDRAPAASLVALVPHGGRDLYDWRPPETVVLLLGAEGPGLGERALRLADERITIPLAPGVESLNLAVAGAVALFEIRRRDSGPTSSPTS